MASDGYPWTYASGPENHEGAFQPSPTGNGGRRPLAPHLTHPRTFWGAHESLSHQSFPDHQAGFRVEQQPGKTASEVPNLPLDTEVQTMWASQTSASHYQQSVPANHGVPLMANTHSNLHEQRSTLGFDPDGGIELGPVLGGPNTYHEYLHLDSSSPQPAPTMMTELGTDPSAGSPWSSENLRELGEGDFPAAAPYSSERVTYEQTGGDSAGVGSDESSLGKSTEIAYSTPLSEVVQTRMASTSTVTAPVYDNVGTVERPGLQYPWEEKDVSGQSNSANAGVRNAMGWLGREEQISLSLLVEPNSANFGPQTTVLRRQGSYLAPPLPPDPISWPLSPSPSEDAPSVSTPAVLLCPVDGCDSSFTGDFRKGNLARHRRRCHGGGVFQCEALHCTRTFKRSDARLKHHRKHHPELGAGPAVRRKPPPTA